MEIISTSTKETKDFAHEIATSLRGGETILLYGELGAGKTTFTNFLVNELGFLDRVQSPTFVLHRVYKKSSESREIKEVHHFDLYRLTTQEEFDDIGISELLHDRNKVVIIEWPDRFIESFSKPIIEIKFDTISENERKINVQNLY